MCVLELLEIASKWRSPGAVWSSLEGLQVKLPGLLSNFHAYRPENAPGGAWKADRDLKARFQNPNPGELSSTLR